MADPNIGSASVSINVDISGLEEGLSKVQGSLEQFSRNSQTFMSAFGAPVKAATSTFASFDDAIRAVGAVASNGNTSLDDLSSQAQKLGATTSFSAQQVAEGMVVLGRSFGNTDKVSDSIAGVMNLSRATGTELATAADIATNALNSFGLQATDIDKVSNVLTATANNSAQSLEDLGEAMKYSASAGALTGHSIEEVSGMLGILANFGIKGSAAGNVLKNVFTRLADPKIAEQINALGVATTNADGSMRNAAEVVADVGAAVKDLPNGEQLNLFQKLFGLRAMGGAAILSQGGGGFADMLGNINQAGQVGDTTAADTAAKMDAGIGGSFRMAQSAIEGVAIALGETLAPIIKNITDLFTGLVSTVTDFIKNNETLVTVLATIGGALAGISASALAISSACSVIMSGIAAVKGIAGLLGQLPALIAAIQTAMATLVANPMVLGITAVAAAIAGIAYWLYRSSTEADRLNKALSQTTDKNNQQRREQATTFNALKAMEGRDLTEGEQKQAQALIDSINGGAMGIKLEGGRLTGVTEAAGGFERSLLSGATIDTKNQIKEIDKQLAEKQKKFEGISPTKSSFLGSMASAMSRGSYQDPGKRNDEYYDLQAEIADLQGQRNKLMTSVGLLQGGALDIATGMTQDQYLSQMAPAFQAVGSDSVGDDQANRDASRTAVATEDMQKNIDDVLKTVRTISDNLDTQASPMTF